MAGLQAIGGGTHSMGVDAHCPPATAAHPAPGRTARGPPPDLVQRPPDDALRVAPPGEWASLPMASKRLPTRMRLRQARRAAILTPPIGWRAARA